MKKKSLISYWPIALIYISAGTLAWMTKYLHPYAMLMPLCMGFILVLFGLLKLRDVKGFVKTFRKYDPIAGRSRLYAYAYPYIEILLGVLFIFNAAVLFISCITIFIYSATLYGAVSSMRKKQKLVCACVGVDFNLPLSHVSTAESIVMIGMCLYMIVGMVLM